VKHNTLGRTGLSVSRIVFGGGVGGALFIYDYEESRDIVRYAIENGINWFDTAPMYGNTQSELRLGRILKELQAPVHLSTKVWLPLDTLDNIPDTVLSSVEASLERLQVNSVDLIQLHNPVTRTRGDDGESIIFDDIVKKNGVIEALDRVRKKGYARYTGCTGFGHAPALKKCIETGGFDTIQLYYNALNPSAVAPVTTDLYANNYQELARVARQHDMGTLAIRVLSAGLLGGVPLEQEKMWRYMGCSDFERGSAMLDHLKKQCNNDSESLYATAISYVLNTPEIDGTLIGFKTLDQITAALAVEQAPPLPEHERERILALHQ